MLGLALVYLGEHYATDLVGGALLAETVRGARAAAGARRHCRPRLGSRRCAADDRAAILYEVSEQKIENVIIIGSGPGRLHGGAVHRASQPRAVRRRGIRVGRAAAADDRRRELPGFPGRDHGPRADGPDAQPGRALRRAAGDRRRRPRSSSHSDGTAPHKVWLGDELHLAKAVILAMGAQHRKLDVPGEDGAVGPRGQLLRDLRRRVLQAGADDHRRRWRLGDGGGDVPLQVRREGRHRPPP